LRLIAEAIPKKTIIDMRIADKLKKMYKASKPNVPERLEKYILWRSCSTLNRMIRNIYYMLLEN
jgi:hypothetical protein